MFLLRKPGERQLQQIRERYRGFTLSYAEVGCSRGTPPRGYTVDHYRARLGYGGLVFGRASQAFRRWDLLRLGWVEPCWPDAPVEQGALVGTLARFGGLWSVNVCRIVYVLDERSDLHDPSPPSLAEGKRGAEAATRFGFAHGTLPGHVECGEERFLLEWHRGDDSVWYDILALSRPGRLLTRLGYPLARRLQKRFARDSIQALMQAVNPLPSRCPSRPIGAQ